MTSETSTLINREKRTDPPSSPVRDAPETEGRPPRRLARFLLNATSLLALVHAYVGLRLLPDMPISVSARWAGAAALLFSLTLLPFTIRARYMRNQTLARALTWSGSFLMGLFSSLFVLTVLRDVVLGLIFLPLSAEHFTDLTRESALAVPLLTLLVTFIGLIDARRRAPVVDVDVPLRALPAELNGFTIIQISDLHVGPTIRRPFVEAVVNHINQLDADLIAITGDLVDGTVQQLSAHTAPLGRLTARHGTYFVTGNHEYYAGAPAWIAELRRLGVKVLQNQHVALDHNGASLIVAGVTDYTAHQFDPANRSDPAVALATPLPEGGSASRAPRTGTPKILLAHQPRTAPAAATAGFDLQLSGHTHGGQFWPWNLFVRFQQPFTAGLHRLQNLWVYTSRGTGYWGPPTRFGVGSEITRLRLIAASS